MEDQSKKPITEFDNYLPLANIGRIIKNNLPKDVKLSKSSKETLQECVSEFISFITSEANDKCNLEKRKIIFSGLNLISKNLIKGEDIIYALNNLGFEKYCPILEIYLKKYKQSQNNNNINDIDEEAPQKKTKTEENVE